MQIDEIAYLDQLHEAASVKLPRRTSFNKATDRDNAKRKFDELVFKHWPEISAAFNGLKHSL